MNAKCFRLELPIYLFVGIHVIKKDTLHKHGFTSQQAPLVMGAFCGTDMDWGIHVSTIAQLCQAYGTLPVNVFTVLQQENTRNKQQVQQDLMNGVNGNHHSDEEDKAQGAKSIATTERLTATPTPNTHAKHD